MKHAPLRGAVFHAILRDCLEAQRPPKETEIQLIACKIWQDSFAAITHKNWHDLVPDGEEYEYTINAARMAFGLHTTNTAA
ncbi:hypothetical protein [Sphingobium sp. Cam5-1]|uniref:hypothetical protein n=1 Tax=Sphingobium sp. Cam5-1 TaxID=2789327 RepID=UPI0018AD2AD9|nr:hypothetical protein [Sphingobium sp. Cam5-1]QPI75242.1 hypothetical protein IZV00_16295 [Sphingobium sp. Cam5-1]